MLFILKVIAALILLAVVVIGIYILLQGKEEMFFEVTQRTKASLLNAVKTSWSLKLSCRA